MDDVQKQLEEEQERAEAAEERANAAARKAAQARLDYENSVVKVQSIGRRKIAQRRVMEQQQRRNDEQARLEKLRNAEISLPEDELEVAKATEEADKAMTADALRHPTHPFQLADPTKFVVKDQDKVAAGMQRVYRRMLQSRSWW